jgi:hypothetical protein
MRFTLRGRNPHRRPGIHYHVTRFSLQAQFRVLPNTSHRVNPHQNFLQNFRCSFGLEDNPRSTQEAIHYSCGVHACDYLPDANFHQFKGWREHSLAHLGHSDSSMPLATQICCAAGRLCQCVDPFDSARPSSARFREQTQAQS